MTLSLVFCFAIGPFACNRWHDAPPLATQEVIPHLERLRIQRLDSVRKCKSLILRNIAILEKRVSYYEMTVQLEMAEEHRRKADNTRKILADYERWERELWGQQPGGITAPPPRPKGTPFRPATVRD